jgi:hypothetical protein
MMPIIVLKPNWFPSRNGYFSNLIVNLQDSLCDILKYVSAQSLDFLDLAKNLSFLNWKLASAR